MAPKPPHENVYIQPSVRNGPLNVVVWAVIFPCCSWGSTVHHERKKQVSNDIPTPILPRVVNTRVLWFRTGRWQHRATATWPGRIKQKERLRPGSQIRLGGWIVWLHLCIIELRPEPSDFQPSSTPCRTPRLVRPSVRVAVSSTQP